MTEGMMYKIFYVIQYVKLNLNVLNTNIIMTLFHEISRKSRLDKRRWGPIISTFSKFFL